MFGRLTVLLAVVLVVCAPAGAATKPKPYMWTPAQAADRLDSALSHDREAFGERASFTGIACRGTGKQVAKRWVAFACTVTVRTSGFDATTKKRPAWLRVRPFGKGGACVSVKSAAAISRACLTAKGLVEPSSASPEGEIQKATTARFNPGSSIPWQGFTALNCLGVDGFYECSFTSAVSGTAVVMFRPAASVRFTSLVCTGDYAARPECAV